MTISFAEQLAFARMAAQRTEKLHVSLEEDKAVDDFMLNEMKKLAKNAGVNIHFEDCSSLSAQCEQVKFAHEIDEIRKEMEQLVVVSPKTPIKGKKVCRVAMCVPVKQVVFGLGIC
jgi:hypothetical protein